MSSLEELKAKLAAKKEDLSKLKVELQEAQEKDWVAEAQLIMDKMNSEFVNGASFLKDSKTSVVKDFHVTSPIGGIRNLWRVLTGKPGVVAAAQRRATNSPIQGFSSEIGAATAYLILIHFDKYRRRFKLPASMFPKYLRAVHDANYFSVPYEFYLPALQIAQYMATYGVANWYKKVFGFKFLVEPEIEMDVGANDATGEAWDWALDGESKARLSVCVSSALIEQVKNGVMTGDQLLPAARLIASVWLDEEKRTYLNSKYPILNVQGLDAKQIFCAKEILSLCKKYLKEQ